MLVGFGLDDQLREPVEVHCYYTTGFLITMRGAPTSALDALRQAGSVQAQLGSDPIRVLHQADDQELAEITAIRRRAAVIRRTSGDRTSTCSPAASKRDGQRSWSSAWD